MLQPDLPDSTLDTMIRRTRSLLLKFPEVLAVRCGKNLDPQNKWAFLLLSTSIRG